MNRDRLKWVTVTLCTYEVTAILTGKVPTISALSARHRWIGPVLTGALTVHLYRYDQKEKSS